MTNLNFGPRKTAVVASLITAITTSFFLLILKYTTPIVISKFSILLLFIAIFTFGYIIYFLLLEKYILPKIKIIYKHITNTKSGKTNAYKVNKRIAENVFESVEQDIELYTNKNRSQLNALRKMEQYRQEFLANLSHEIKTPIFNIQGYIETLIDGGLEDKNINLKYLQKASKNVDRLSILVSDIDLISKLEEGALSCKPIPTNFKKTIFEVVESLDFQIQIQKITIEYLNLQLAENVMADEKMMKQVLTNLIVNAIKYNDKNNKNLNIFCFDMVDKILIEISDNGMGIEKNHIPRLFERFYRVDSNRSREQGGTGLGLSIVKHIVEAHQQKLNVRSSVRIGSTFGFTLDKVV